MKNKSEFYFILLFFAKESEIKRTFMENKLLILLVYKESYFNLEEANQSLSSLAIFLLQKFEDVFPDKIRTRLPPIKGIEHQNDFIPRVVIIKRPVDKSNHK